MNNIVKTGHATQLSIRDEQTGFDEPQIAALNQIGMGGAPNGDLQVFFHQVKRTGLDPFARQIYMIQRKGKWTIQTGIDGFRLIARRATNATNGTLGYEDTQWCDSEGVWHDVWIWKNPPAAARVTVVRNGERFPAIATYSEYVGMRWDQGRQVANSMWASKPALMLAKCAEALALRKAFPQDLSGLYTADEMDQAGNPPQQVQQQYSNEEREAFLAELPNIDNLDELRDVWKKAIAMGFRDEVNKRATEIQKTGEKSLVGADSPDEVEPVDAEVVEDESD